MKNKLVLGIFVFGASFLPAFGQISEGGTPPSFGYQTVLRSTTASYDVPVNLNIENLLKEDAEEGRRGVPLRYAVVIPVAVNIDSTGVWTTLPNSDRIWRQTVSAQGATGIILSYNDFYIPEGGKLFIYNADKSQVLGSFSHNTHPEGGAFSTEIIFGDVITLEYVASTISNEKPRIDIKDIGYAYRPLTFLRATNSFPINGSQSCMVNINCPAERNWGDQKRGVVGLLIKGTPARWFYCSGSLITNTAEDGKPYILTANHCMKSLDYLNEMAFYFNYEFSGCGNENVEPATTKTLIGCSVLANIPLLGGSDGTLLQIKNIETIPLEWKPYYNGWDISNQPSPTGAVIHHPNGDVKKIAHYQNSIKTATLTSENAAPNAHWELVYDGNSVTQGGSSGSPLFNDKGLIIGTLSAGASSCLPSELKLPDFYGKIAYHWAGYDAGAGNPEQKMKPFLDPLAKNVTSQKGYDPNGYYGIEDAANLATKQIIVFPNPADSELNINANSIIRQIYIYDLNGRRLYSETGYNSSTKNMSITGWSAGVYQIILQTEIGRLSERFIKK